MLEQKKEEVLFMFNLLFHPGWKEKKTKKPTKTVFEKTAESGDHGEDNRVISVALILYSLKLSSVCISLPF